MVRIFAGLVNLFGKQGEGQGQYWHCALRPSDIVCLCGKWSAEVVVSRALDDG